jgi:radical SAM-linked protein
MTSDGSRIPNLVPRTTLDPTPKQRMRIRFSKGEAIKYISHLDLARTWERLFRRASLPIAYSQGFNPHPRFQIAAGLPVGVSGRSELLDVWLEEPLSPEEVLNRLRPVSPAGLEALCAEEVDLGAPALQSLVQAAEYRAVVRSHEPVEGICTRIQALLDMPAIPRQRHHKGKWQSYDLRPLIQGVAVEAGPEGVHVLTMRLQASARGAGRPDEVLDVLGLSLAAATIERTKLCFEFDKSRGDGIIAVCEGSGGIGSGPRAS